MDSEVIVVWGSERDSKPEISEAKRALESDGVGAQRHPPSSRSASSGVVCGLRTPTQLPEETIAQIYNLLEALLHIGLGICWGSGVEILACCDVFAFCQVAQWPGREYHLLKRNCCHFASEAPSRLRLASFAADSRHVKLEGVTAARRRRSARLDLPPFRSSRGRDQGFSMLCRCQVSGHGRRSLGTPPVSEGRRSKFQLRLLLVAFHLHSLLRAQVLPIGDALPRRPLAMQGVQPNRFAFLTANT